MFSFFLKLSRRAQPFESEIAYWNENRNRLIASYPNKWLLIEGSEIVGSFDSPELAILTTGRLGRKIYLKHAGRDYINFTPTNLSA